MSISRDVPLLQAAEDPLQRFVNARVDQILDEFKHLPDNDLELVPLVLEAYLRGMRDGTRKIGELI